tara:strand:- start:5836 stop:6564 length:729 start_codon:yes stop_codon:yes gene_type:complete
MKVIILTGATRGLGLKIAETLKTNNFKVIALGRIISDSLQKLIENQNLPGEIIFYDYDFSCTEGIYKLSKKIKHDHGKVFGLINNAAIGADGILATMHEKQINQAINVNLISPIILTKYVSRFMLTNGEGRIINISSIISKTGFSGLSVYGATKGGLVSFSKSLARELGKAEITVNNILPGYMKTDMTKDIDKNRLEVIKRRSPLGRLVSTEEVAEAVNYLLSDDAKNITGIDFVIDAGNSI